MFMLTVIVSGSLFMVCVYEGDTAKYKEIEYVIGVSQANMVEPWRLVLMDEIKQEAARHSNVRLIAMDAASDSVKQEKDVKELLGFGVDLLIISPCDEKLMTPIIRDVYNRIPVIVLDKAVEGFDYTLFIGPDNESIGRKAGEDLASILPDGGRVLEICGNRNSQSSTDKSAGFETALKPYQNITITQCIVNSEFRDEAEDTLLNMGTDLENIDVIFAHNDYMANGAYKAVRMLGYNNIRIIGVDGFIGQNDGIDMVERDQIYETIACSTGGRESIQFAMDILNEVSGVPKQIILRDHSVTKENVEEYVAMNNREPVEISEIITVGYSQIGSESAWRIANTKSIKQAAKDQDINLIYEDAQQSQAKQIESIRKFIALKVDVIVLSPVVDSGWDEVLKEAKDARIPVILSDRKADVEDDSLVMTYIGADFLEEGRRAMNWIKGNVIPVDSDTVRIMEIKGTQGSSPSVERSEGFKEVLTQNPRYEIVYTDSGDFTFESGQKIVEQYIAGNVWDIDVIYAHNDDMALGAIKALKENGLNPGVDVKIVSIDATKDAFNAMIDGTLNCAVECSPMLGPQLMKAVRDLMEGKQLPLRIITDEKIFTQENAKAESKNRPY